ncbi:protein of unknown function [Paraburkholderia dioscoreae]|uniref:Uncharacterized protein n=1 Tax=Paraburkholderia dioscoreae TaxID=2604047 RepID=A0A5Q4ZNG8_9BURK|nr:protein of unknown function [Paraburkholderia dioscoreae]
MQALFAFVPGAPATVFVPAPRQSGQLFRGAEGTSPMRVTNLARQAHPDCFHDRQSSRTDAGNAC